MSRMIKMSKLNSKRFVLWTILAAMLVGSSAVAQRNKKKKPAAPKKTQASIAQLYKTAMTAYQGKRYQAAVDGMYQYLNAVKGSEMPRVIEKSQEVRYTMATILLSFSAEERPSAQEEAAMVLKAYSELPYGKKRREVLMLLAKLQYDVGTLDKDQPNKKMLEGAIETVGKAFEYDKNPQNESTLTDKKSTAEEDEEGAKVDYQSIIEAGDAEEPYTPDDYLQLYMFLAESYFYSGQWEESIEPYEYAIANAKHEQSKGYAIMQIINALVKLDNFERINEWIPQLYRTSARYDIRVNRALMNVAESLYRKKIYDGALTLYRMILPRDELVAYQESALREMRIQEGMTPEENMEVSDAEKYLFGTPDTAEGGAVTRAPEEKSQAVLDQELLIETLMNLPPYENDLMYQMGSIYQEVERLWEAVTFFSIVFDRTPDSDLGERAIYDSLEILMEELNDYEEGEQRAFAYLDVYKSGMTPRMVAYLLNTHYRNNKQLEKLKTLFPYLEGFDRSTLGDTEDIMNQSIIKYDIELYFMQAVADLMLFKFADAEAAFKRLLDEYPDSHQAGNTLYWYGMSKIFQQKYPEAAVVFEEYTTTFPEGPLADESYYQGGVCMFGVDQYDEALERFTFVIETYPDSTIFPEACNRRGDIYGSKALLDEAVADYQLAIDKAYVLTSNPDTNVNKTRQATYATFQMAKVFEAESRNDEIIEAVTAYLEPGKWPDPDIAKGLFWLGKTKIQQGLVDEAVLIYVDAIVQYGGDLSQDGVDSMIDELTMIASAWLKPNDLVRLNARLNAALSSTENETLQLRLRVLMAKLNGSEIELGKLLINELSDLEFASPPVLEVICKASFEIGDYSRAEEILDTFITRYDESDFVRSAYKLRASGQYAAKDYDGALQTIKETQDRFGLVAQVVWSQLMMAQVLLDAGRYDEAHKANMLIVSVPDFRGAPVAQATYQLGQVQEKLGEWTEAFGYYQRTYFLFKGHAGGYWAAEAYLASARCLKKLGRTNDVRNTYRAMLFDKYVNTLPQADVARQALGAVEVAGIEDYILSGATTNISIEVTVPTNVTTNVKAGEVE